MDLQRFADSIEAMASVYSFEKLADGSFGEIKLMAVNKYFSGLFTMNPNAPKFYPGIPYRYYFRDVNFEQFCYKSASEKQALYSYVNAHNVWLTGLYFPVESDRENVFCCCYILKYTKEVDTENLSKRSAEVSSAVLNMSIKLHKNQDFIKSMAEIAGDIRAICGSEMCSIVMLDKNDKSCTFINENGKNDGYMQEISAGMGRTPYEVALAWQAALKGTDCFILDDLSIIKERDPIWYKSLNDYSIKSIVLYSLNFNGELVGFIWAANFNSEKMMHIKETLELSTYFISAVIANRQLLSRLEVMSMVDMLTEVKNRNAMNKRIDTLLKAEAKIPELPASLGIVYADINGLKLVNDTEGHEAGDRLLKKASSLLKTEFGDHEIYRAGGDEFVILCPDISQAELDKRIGELKKLLENTSDVSIAIAGDLFTGKYDIRSAMHQVDEKMYLDKQEYYRLNPDKKRHANN